MNYVEISWNYEIGVLLRCYCRYESVTVVLTADMSLSQCCYCRFKSVTVVLL